MVNTLKIVPYLYDGFAPRLHSIPAYFDANMALLKPDVRRELFDAARPIKTKDRSDPSTYYAPGSRSVNSLVADGCIIDGEVDVTVKKVGNEETHSFKSGDMFSIEKNVIHSFDYKKFTTLIVTYDKGVELPDDTKDIYSE